MKISIIIPCYNEEEVLPAAVPRLIESAGSSDWQVEYIFIDDGSSDSTLDKLLEFKKKDQRIKIISFSRNFGHQAAVSAGLKHASGDAAVIIDADMQDPPELIPEMVEMWKNGSGDIIYGKRLKRFGETFLKKATASIFYRLLKMMSNTEIPVDTGDFRLIDRKVIDAFNSLPERNKYIRGLIPWLGFKAVPLEYERDTRAAGETKYSFSKMIKLASDGLLSFSRKPLQIATSIGLFTLLVGIGLIIYVFISYFSNRVRTIPGWASTVVIIIFFSGIQLLTLGIIGSYLGRVFDEVKRRPEYVIQRFEGFDNQV